MIEQTGHGLQAPIRARPWRCRDRHPPARLHDSL